MAAEVAIEGLCEEATCSICLEYFVNPVTIDCGHNFCQACFHQLWEDPNVDSCCPQCRERIKQKNFKPNRQLANIVEIVRNFQEKKGLKRKWEEPQRQEEPLKISWREDQAPAGVFWERLHAQQGHTVSSVSKISVKYKAQLEVEKQKIRSAFQRMQVFLRVKQHLWLGELGDLEKKIWKRGEGNFAELAGELSRLNHLITAMEVRNPQPLYGALQPPTESLQDIRRAFRRCEKNASEHESDLSHWWQETLRIAAEKISALERATEKYKVFLEQVQDTAPLMQDLNKVDVTLNPNTAHPSLIISEDLRSVWWEVEEKKKGGKKKKKKGNIGATGNLPDSPERFDWELCVLGQEGFTAGKHWWVVEVEGSGRSMWAVGVAQDTMRRKGFICTNTNEGVWAVGRFSRSPSSPRQFFAFTCPAPTPLDLAKDPRKIRVSLDYERGQVQFSNADTNDLIFTYYTGSFSGEKLRPFFQLRSSETVLKCCRLSPAAMNRRSTGSVRVSRKVRPKRPSARENFHCDQGWIEF